MSAFFELRLDTTGPVAQIFAPSYTMIGMETEITVQADEELSPNHEIWVEDGEGKRFYLTFSRDGDKLVGLYNFNDFSRGMVTIWARVKDEVLNVSELVSKPINLLAGTHVRIEGTPAETREATIECHAREFVIDGSSREFGQAILTRSAELAGNTRRVEVDCID